MVINSQNKIRGYHRSVVSMKFHEVVGFTKYKVKIGKQQMQGQARKTSHPTFPILQPNSFLIITPPAR